MTNQEHKMLTYVKRNAKTSELSERIGQIEEKLEEIIDLYFNNNVLLSHSKELSASLNEELIGFKTQLTRLDEAIRNPFDQENLIRELNNVYKDECEKIEIHVDKKSQELTQKLPQLINDKVDENYLSLKNYLDEHLKAVEQLMTKVELFESDVKMDFKKMEKAQKSLNFSKVEYSVVLLEEIKNMLFRYNQKEEKKQQFKFILEIAGFGVLFVMILFLYFI